MGKIFLFIFKANSFLISLVLYIIFSNNNFRSQGYQYDWKIEEAQKNLLRTHTTAVSARMLYKLAREKEFKPVKYFSIDRVFRNETLDSTHLAEFHQVIFFTKKNN